MSAFRWGTKFWYARLLGVGAIFGCLISPAGAVTIATFSDPAADGSTPLFTLQAPTFTGGWTLPGLTLQTPQFAPFSFPDVTFDMTPLTVSALGMTTGGTINFYDNANQILFTMVFDSGTLAAPFGFGATEFLAQNVVVFSGTIVTMPLEMESFTFSFANFQPNPNGFTTTAAFTSSAVPEPASAALLALAGLGAWRRRR